MRNPIEEARTHHGEHTTHGKFIQELADCAEAAKRDAEEAEAYAAELEVKLAKAVELLETPNQSDGSLGRYHYNWERVDDALAQLKGQNHD
jgi:hypothetical protein